MQIVALRVLDKRCMWLVEPQLTEWYGRTPLKYATKVISSMPGKMRGAPCGVPRTGA